MSVAAIRWDGYAVAEEADRRFRQLLVALAIPFLLLSVLSFLYKIEGQKAGGGTYVAPATVELLPPPQAEKAEKVEEPAPAKDDQQKPQEAAPKVTEKPVETPKPVIQPTPAPVETAREVAKRSGVLAFADQLSDLRNKGDTLSSDSLAPNVLSSKGAASSTAGASGGGANEAQALAAATAGSSGIGGTGTAGVSHSVTGQGLGKRRTTTLDSPVGFGRDVSKSGEGGTKAKSGRSLDEIQLTFDRAQGSFYAMYIRALRENPGLSGKVVLSVTIAASGKVTEAHIVSSELGDPELERKIVARVMLLDFGAKDVPSFTYPNYPIRFQPPN